MKKIENRRTDKKNAYIMGIKGKLYVAIGIIDALTISMGAISWHLFQTSSTMIGEITKKTVPAMLAAAKVSTNTAQLNEEIPNIASVKNVEELKQTYTALKSYNNKQKELVDGIKIVKHDQKLA